MSCPHTSVFSLHCAQCYQEEIADLHDRLATAERERDKAVAAKELAERELNLQCNSMSEQWNAEVDAVKRERDDAIAACQQKHGVHPSWVNAVEKMRKERDEALEKLAARWPAGSDGAVRRRSLPGTQ